ncbi:MAG: Ig-like domain-containing protein, partial [Spirochaetota bacterium]
RLIYTGSGAEEVTATVLKPSTGAGRFQNIIIEFSHAMDRGTVCPDANLDDNHNEGIGSPITIYETNNTNNKIYGRCFWGVYNGTNFTSYTQLIFDPYKPLDPNKSYSIAIPNGKTVASIGGVAVEKICLTTGNCNPSGITTSFTTEYNYDATFAVNNLTLGSNGVVLNKASASTVTLTSNITNSGQADIVLKKIGSTGTVAWSNSMQLSDVTPGSNSYVVEIKKGTKTYYRSFSFAWGTTATDPTTYVNDAGTLAIGNDDYGVKRLAMLLQRFIKSDGSNSANTDNFTIPSDFGRNAFLDYVQKPKVSYYSNSDPNGAGFPSNGHPTTGRNNQPCISNVGIHPDFNWISNFGPLCNIGFSIENVPLLEGANLPFPLSLFNIPLPGIFAVPGSADVYVKDVHIPNDITEDGSNNIEAELTPQNDRLDAILRAKRLDGTLRLHLRVPGKCFGVPVDLEGPVCDPPPLIPKVCFKVKGCVGVELNAKGIVYDLDFRMNPAASMTALSTNGSNKSNPPFGTASARNHLKVDSNGNVTLGVISVPNSSQGCGGDTNMNVCDVDNKILAYNARMVNEGELNIVFPFNIGINVNDIAQIVVEYLLNNILNNLVPNLKWEIVQGVLKDVLEVVAPSVLNALFAQLKFEGSNNGMDVQLPDYLPAPFNQTKLLVGVKLKETNTNATKAPGLGLDIHAGIRAEISGSPTTPPALQTSTAAVNSFVKLDVDTSGNPIATPPLDGSIGLYTRLSSEDGALIALRADAVNQAMYQLWKAGGFNLTLNQSFADTIKAFRGDDDRLFQIFQILLKASALKKVLAPGAASVMYAKDQSKGDTLIQVRDSDDMEFRITPLQPPVLKALPLSESKALTDTNSGKKFPLVEAEFGGLKIEVVGKRSGLEYKMATLLVNFRSKAALNIGKFNSPIHSGNNDYQNVTSVKLNICDDNDHQNDPADPSKFDCDTMRSTYTENDDLSYSVQVLEGASNNPLGLDPGGIYDVLEPTVQKLIIPVLNHVLADLPLEQKSKDYNNDNNYDPDLTNFAYDPGSKEDPNQPNNKIAANCGIRLNDMKILPIPASESSPYFLINAKLSDYTFSGSCSL